jgi:hypothetical protein
MGQGFSASEQATANKISSWVELETLSVEFPFKRLSVP